jgi:methylmalonyl-CoA mutase
MSQVSDGVQESESLVLAADFPHATRADWRKLVDGVLKGAPFQKLEAKTYDGLNIEPIYERAAGTQTIPGRAAGTPWQITQQIDHPDVEQANAQALQDLENGANGLTLVFAGANSARGFGLDPSAGTLARVLDGVFLDAGISLTLEIGPTSRDIGEHLTALLIARNISPAAVNVRFGFDPIGGSAVRGGSDGSWESTATVFAAKVADLAARGFKGPFAPADGRVIHDAGGTEAQELAFVLATCVAYLRALESAGIDLEDAQRMIYARMSADADQFLTMAKFRALRLLWARIEQGCGLKPKPLFITADTAWRMLTQRDAYVNILRATAAVFSAGLGGADSITVLPHTLALGLPDALARRIARNTQLLLLEESHLAKVADPAAGSGGIEALTLALCETAWKIFQDIERAGGVFAALEQNIIQKNVAAVRDSRAKKLAARKEVLIGASEFPNLRERFAQVLAVREDIPKPSKAQSAAIKFDALMPIRLAAPFEKLRDRSDRILREKGIRPKIFLANLGTPADFTTRATFATSLFETGGIEAISNDGFLPERQETANAPSSGTKASGETPRGYEGLASAFASSGATMACLCSSDEVYETYAEKAAQTLHAAGATYIYLAGRPGDHESALRDAGVDEFVFTGGDALATLETAYGRIKAA